MSNLKIWQILEGPISIEDVPLEESCPENSTHFCICKAEIDGKIEEMNIWFESFDDAYSWFKYFKSHIEPLELSNNLDLDS
tara:strand:- start:1219 stop:1461 length:243 start_codon:yes stop_codon:yes gene_type:complete